MESEERVPGDEEEGEVLFLPAARASAVKTSLGEELAFDWFPSGDDGLQAASVTPALGSTAPPERVTM
ncbi:hypothetical protein EYF80_057827 [Liparis tanakae]|uniref:Uncharacterized protein n=1 Tax=Liparis tanakae TaxID=230148 RepID=A0A4Z2ET44_9TELE|nr:hypothetical protein EYF80_057827 [Liparis tanakae]